MKVIAKYPIIVKGEKENRVILNNKYEGGFSNGEGDTTSQPTTPAPAKRDWAKTISDVANSGIVQSGASIVNQIQDAKKKPQQPTAPVAGSPVATGGPTPAPDHSGKPQGMSTGTKVGIAIGVVGLGVVIYLVAKHHKASK